jgi:FtsZ-binding cell division protein ZapB
MEKETKIICPNCGTELDVNTILYHQLEEDLRKKFNSQLNEERKKFEGRSEALDREKEKLEEEKKMLNDRVRETVAQRLKLEKEISGKR